MNIIYLLIPNLSLYYSNQQRSQKIFKATLPMDLQAVRTKLLGFGMQLLDDIDPNPDNFVCAGIVHMRSQQVGCLLRLEPNKQAQVCILVNYTFFIKTISFSSFIKFLMNCLYISLNYVR